LKNKKIDGDECGVCPKGKCDDNNCKNPCVECPMRNDCLTEETDIRIQCNDFSKFYESVETEKNNAG
jgi:hypothetical protein